MQVLPRCRNKAMVYIADLRAFREAHLEANGGREFLEGLLSTCCSGQYEKAVSRCRFVRSSDVRAITTLQFPDYELSFVVSGDRVWQRIELPGQEAQDTLKEGAEADAMRDLGYFYDPIMRVILDEPEAILSLDPGVWQDRSCYVMEFKSATRGMQATVYVDAATMTPLLRSETFADGKVRQVHYSDYRKIKGFLQEPYRIETCEW